MRIIAFTQKHSGELMGDQLSDSDLLWSGGEQPPAVVEPAKTEMVMNWPAVVLVGVVLTGGGALLAADVRSSVGAVYQSAIELAANSLAPLFEQASPVVPAPEKLIQTQNTKAPIQELVPVAMPPDEAKPLPNVLPSPQQLVAGPHLPPTPAMALPVAQQPVAEAAKPIVADPVKVAPGPLKPAPAKVVAQPIAAKPLPSPLVVKPVQAPIAGVVTETDISQCEALFKRGVVSSSEAGVKAMTAKGAAFRGCVIRPGVKIGTAGEIVESIDPGSMVVRTNRRVLTIVD